MAGREHGRRHRVSVLSGDDEPRLSPTALAFAAVFVIVIVVAIGAGILFLNLLSEQGPDLAIEVGYDGSTLRVHHEGGIELPPGDFRLLVDGRDRTGDARFEDASKGRNFSVGRTLVVSAPAPVQGVQVRYEGDQGAHVVIAERYAEEFVRTGRDDPWAMDFPPSATTTPRAAEVPPREYTFPPAPAPKGLAEPPRAGHLYVAAADSFLPSSGEVIRCDGSADEVEITEALRRAGTVELLEGTFHLSRRLTVPGYTVLAGQGRTRTVLSVENASDPYQPIEIAQPYVTVRDLRVEGQGFFRISASHVRIRDVVATSRTRDGRLLPSGGNGMFFVWADRSDVEDVEFYSCTAYDCSTHGFNMNQDFSDRVPRTTRAIRFVNCYAALCGYGTAGGSRSPWITGFDLQETQDLVDCQLINCISESNWESGFHAEPGARLDGEMREIGPRTRCEGLVLTNCVAKNNGWRNTDPGRFFLSGFYIHRNAVLSGCRSIHNRNAGFYVQGGSSLLFDRCTDSGSTYGWRIMKSSQEIRLSSCTSSDARAWAIWAAYASRLQVENFTQVRATGARGVQSILGWYKDNARYGRPVTDSTFEITVIGPSPLAPINRDGSGNRFEIVRAGG
ncbi:MAG TPA: right-handed parallel beta-helix repeat-containing protein [Methanoregulaceae archaeon]|nr:right-handed parallel beta-helix repeat-containing protein [Methanoregulaceae archaeon]HQJ87579.1 right-handed parallel beta-helix repeat-containing protein [Methanoregulaceae archaeon]